MRALAGGLVGLLAALAALVACTSFDAPAISADGDAGADAAIDGATPDGSGDGTSPLARGCPKPIPPDTFCVDFDDVSQAPAGDQRHGTFSIDTSRSWSPERSLLVSTADGVTEPRWAFLEHVISGAPKKLRFDQRVRIGQMTETEIGQISVRNDTQFYAVILVIKGSTLELREGVYKSDGSAIANAAHGLGLLSGKEWMRLTVDLDLEGVGGPTPRRKVTVSVDDVPKVTVDDGNAPGGLALAVPQQTAVAFGITWTDGADTTPRKMNLDDVIVSWTP